MRPSRTLQRIKSGETVRICSLGHFIPAYVKHAAHFGYDCIWLDLEHRRMESTQVQLLLALSHTFDIDIMVRTPTLQKPELYAFLEDGAAGLMVPHVNTVERAQELVNATKFPPLGDRGLDGAGMDGDFYVDRSENFPEEANRETFLVVQIETPEAVRNVDSIAATPGVDGLFVGPGDLGLRLRQQPDGPTLDECIQLAADAASKHGKAWGLPVGSREDLVHRRDQGAQLIAHGGDFMAVMNMLEQSSKAFDDK